MATAAELHKALSSIRWSATAALSGYRNLSAAGASASARLSLESIVDVLDRLDDADGAGVFGPAPVKGAVREEATVVDFRRLDRAKGDPLQAPSCRGALGQSGDSLKDHALALDVEQSVGFEQHTVVIDSGDKVVLLFDRLADRVARARLAASGLRSKP